MRTLSIFGQVLTLAALCAFAAAQSGTHYHTGKLLQMESVQCVVQSQGSTGGESKPCQEYVLQGEGVLFHLHLKAAGEKGLLPIGKNLQYRLEEGRLYLRLNGHDREYSVVAMEPLEPPQAPVHAAQKINHLQ